MRAQSVSSAVRARAWQAAMRRLQRVGAEGAALGFGGCLGAGQRGKAAADQELVPARAVLVEQQDRLA